MKHSQSRRNLILKFGAITLYSQIFKFDKAQAFISASMRRARRKLPALFAWGFNTNKILTIASPATVSVPTQMSSTAWTKIEGDEYVTFAINSSGQLWAWGQDYYEAYIFGNNTLGSTYSSPILIGTNWRDIYVSPSAVLGIKTDNTLWGWGVDYYGVLPLVLNTPLPVYPVAALSPAPLMISSNNSFGEMSNTVLLGADNLVYGFGSNEQNQLGQNSATTIRRPIQLAPSTVLSVSAGTEHSAAVVSDGTVWSSGSNLNGPFGSTAVSSSVYVQSPTAGTNNKSIAAGECVSYVIKTDNSLWYSGQSPDQSGVKKSSFTQLGSATNWAKVVCRNLHAMGIQSTGSLWSWGEQLDGRLGLGDADSRSEPVQIGAATNWKDLSTGESHSFGINLTGDLYAWGANLKGQLGLGHITNVSTPVKLGTATWSKVSGGMEISAGIQSNGTLWIWGNMSGLGTLSNLSAPLQIGVDTDWTNVVASTRVVFAQNSSGAIYSMGDTYHGNAGNTYTATTPIQFGTETTWKKLAFRDAQVLAIKTDNSLWHWGWTTNTMTTAPVFGVNSTRRVSTPIQVGTESTWIECAAHYGTMMAIKSTGTLWSWGNSAAKGGLATAARSTPVQVGTQTDWTQIQLGINCAFGLRGNNLWAWGNPTKKELGTGAGQVAISSPVQVTGVWQKISVGYEHVVAIKGAQLFAWGLNTSGQVGDGSMTNRSSPVLIGASSDWQLVAASAHFSYARRDV